MSDNLINPNISTAIYTEQVLSEYKGNPFIEALPPILSPEEAFEEIKFFPEFDEKEINLPTHLRFHAIAKIDKFFHPVMQHIKLEQRFSKLIRQGYVSRNPNLPEFNRALHRMSDIRSTASSLTLMGFSGMGKSTAIERILSLYPQVILHVSPLNFMQITWLKLNCPHDGSLKTLCMDFFIKIDGILGTNYYEKYGGRHKSISSMVVSMGQVAKMHCIGALVIDEIQHLLDSKGNNLEGMMNYFVTLVNEIGVPVIMIGTMRAKAILQKDFRQARRGSAQGDMVWENMKNDDDWEWIIEELWKYQWFKDKTELTQELKESIYEESQGILYIAVKLFAFSQLTAIESGCEVITPTLIEKVAKEDLKLVQPMLTALKNGHFSELEKYTDITPMSISDYIVSKESKVNLKETIQKKKEINKQKKNRENNDNLIKLIIGLTDLGIDEKISEKSATKSIEECESTKLPELMKLALNFANEINENSKKKSVKKNKNEAVLLNIFEFAKKNKRSNYEELKQHGYIKSPLEEFNF